MKRLIDRFNQQSEQVRAPDYNETQLRIDFINPMFAELGWDMDNRQGFAEQYREVVHEDRVKIAGATKAPDYSFRIGGVRKFFLEAKKPFVNIKEAWEPAYQLRRYAWSAKLPVSLLTDFEEFAVYDTRIAPKPMEKASVARREYITYTDYPDRWDFLLGTFSKNAILTGEFDRYCATQKGRGAQEFDQAFLLEIEDWRKKLALNLALRNPDLSEQSLNFAVQRIIDRIIFLRICEDRGAEPVGHLQQLLNGEKTYARLATLFREADARYNSGLFHFKREPDRDETPDELTQALDVDDITLKSILKRLYYPESPYEFSVVSADILGSVYERFLGSVIELTAGHRAKIEPKPEVRKAGGVYYTPTYIVDYIVKQTVGKLVEGKTPKEAAKVKVLDPACGSGSFLLGAYQFLLDWHLQWYVKDGPEKWSKGKNATIRPADRPTFTAENAGTVRDPSPVLGHWALTTRERKRILIDNIHGVDIDYQAVEVTKLSLLLRCLEGETAESLRAQMVLFHERALPDLGKNIICGNSLIGTDIMTTEAWSEMSEEEREKTNPLDFEGPFKDIMSRGGFNAVIGNPPYVRSVTLKASSATLWEQTRTRYKSSADREWDLYMTFVERGLNLLAPMGLLGYILPNKFLNSQVGANLRSLISEGRHLKSLINFDAFQIFGGVTTYTCLLFLGRSPSDTFPAFAYKGALDGPKCLMDFSRSDLWVSSEIATNPGSGPWNLNNTTSEFFARLRTRGVLGDFVDIFQGTGTRADRVFLVEERRTISKDAILAWSDELQREVKLERRLLRPALRGRSVKRYGIEPTRTMLIVPYDVNKGGATLIPEARLARETPLTLDYLRACRTRLNEREEGRFAGAEWYCFGRPQNMSRFEVSEKLILPDVVRRGQCSLDRNGLWLLDTAYGIVPKVPKAIDFRLLLALLNSRMLTFFLKTTGTPLRGGYFRMKTAYLRPFPIPSSDDRKVVASIVESASSMLTLVASEQTASSPPRREKIAREIQAPDHQIDQFVYKLYGLNNDEIRLVEESTK